MEQQKSVVREGRGGEHDRRQTQKLYYLYEEWILYEYERKI